MSEQALPESWEQPLIDACCDLNPRIDKSAIANGKNVHFVPMPAVEALTNKVDISATRPFVEVKKGYTPFADGDVIFAKITPCMENGKIAVVPALENGLAFGSTEFHVIRPLGKLPPLWFFYFLSSRSFRSEAEHNMTGAVGQRRVPIGFIAQSPIPLPPLAEQTRIVSKIEELFSDLDAGEESLRQARRQLGLYRQSLLKQAFEGKLTKAWRAENPDQLESPDQLLARIQTEREERYEKRLKEWKSTVEKWQASGKNSKKPSAPKKPTAIDPINGSELNELAKLPKGWSWFRFGDIVSVRSGEGLTATMMREGDFPVYGGNGISGMHDEFRHVEPRLIIGRVGAKCGVVHITKPKSWVTDNALVADFWIISADMKFFQLLFSFKDLNKQSVSTAQPVVSGAKLNPLPMQFPSLPEQQEIVRLLDAQFTVIEQNEREIDTALKRSEALRQSILKKAFTGQLVPQDPTDEPASVLLARIQAEHESANS